MRELSARDAAAFRVMRETTAADAPIVGVFGNLADPGPKFLETIATFVKRYGMLLGFPAGTMPPELDVRAGSMATGGGTAVMFPVKNGVGWIGGAIGFHFDRDQRLVGVTGRYNTALPATLGSSDAGAAVRRGLAEIGKKFPGAYLSSDGVVHEYLRRKGGALETVYDVRVSVDDSEQPRRVRLGPDGELLSEEPGGEYFDADGIVIDGYPARSFRRGAVPKIRDAYSGKRRFPLDGDLAKGESSAFYRAMATKGHFDFPETFVMTFTSGKKRRLSHPRMLETTVYHHLMRAYEKAVELGATEVADAPTTFDPWQRPRWTREEGWGSTVDNAYYSKGDDSFHFDWYTPGYDFRHPAADPSVIYHEFGHFVHWRLNRYWDLVEDALTNGDAGAISEGFGDYFSMLLTGEATVAGVYFGSGNGRTPSLTPGYCELMPIYQKGATGVFFPAGAKTEIHDAAPFFAGICRELSSNGALGDKPAARVFEALRITIPATFKSFALALVAVQMRLGDASKVPLALDVFERAGIFKPCPSGSAP